MDVTLTDLPYGLRVAEVAGTKEVLRSESDAEQLIGNASFQGVDAMLLDATHLPPAFFDLSAGFAGEILHKFANYRMRLVIVRAREGEDSESLKESPSPRAIVAGSSHLPQVGMRHSLPWVPRAQWEEVFAIRCEACRTRLGGKGWRMPTRAGHFNPLPPLLQPGSIIDVRDQRPLRSRRQCSGLRDTTVM